MRSNERCTKPGVPIMLQAFDPEAEFEIRERNLPHWRQKGATYFVTFRLADSLPQVKLAELKAQRMEWLRRHPRPRSAELTAQFQGLFSEKIEGFLAAGYGACWLKNAQVAELMATSLSFFDNNRYVLGDYVIMPNHVHVIVRALEDYKVSDVVQSEKS